MLSRGVDGIAIIATTANGVMNDEGGMGRIWRKGSSGFCCCC